MYGIFKGLRVVEVAEWVFVPTAAAILADWGADVVKIEHPVRGDAIRGLSSLLTVGGGPGPEDRPRLEMSNRGKRNIAVDISTSAGQEVLYKLVDEADVFLTNFLPDTQERLRIAAQHIRGRNPRIVYASGSGWGTKGPHAGKPGFDLSQAWAAGGIAYQMTAPDDSEPANMPSSVGDLTGGLALAGGIAAALYQREKSGEGAEVDVSLYNVGMWFTSQRITAAGCGVVTPPGRKRAENLNPLVSSYRTKDGRWLWLCFTQPDRWWPDLCRHLKRPDLIDDPRFATIRVRAENRAECVKVLDEIFAAKTLDEWRTTLATLEGAWAAVASPEEIGSDPQVLANGYFPEAKGENGSMRVVAAPIQFNGEPTGDLRTMSEFGADTENVLLELGYQWEDIVSMNESGTIV